MISLLDKILSQPIQSAFFKGISGLLMFFSISFLVRYLGEQAYGVWILVFSFFQWGLYFDFGISNVLKSKIPELISKNENHKINLFISESIKLTTLISIVLFLMSIAPHQLT